jgi:hypothetical protein
MRNFLTGNEFVWFFGIIEDRNDPIRLGRVRVRCIGFHTDDKDQIPTEDLPWAQQLQDITSAASGGTGRSPTGIIVGSWVIGFFADGDRAQEPIILGTLAGIPASTNESDVNKLARGINSIIKTPDTVTGEPASPYAAQYPTNHVFESESGHVVEIDDTANAERIHVYHRSGTFIEMHPNGDVVTHHKNGFRTVTGNDKLHVTGDLNIVADGNVTIDGKTINLNSGTKGAARIGDTADTGDKGGIGSGSSNTLDLSTGSLIGSDGTNKVESGSRTVFIGD